MIGGAMIIFVVLGKAANEAEAFAAIYPHALDKGVPMAGPEGFKLPISSNST
jgi:hypothetical protein